MSTSPRQPPRYLRFVRGLALGALVAATGCGDDDAGETDTDAGMVADAGMDAGLDAGTDAGPVDSGPPDGNVPIDGPLHPPDLPRRLPSPQRTA